MAILKPYTFTAGTKARASEVNANFDALYTEVNSLESKIIDYDAELQRLQNTKADANGNYLNRFAVADAVTSYDAVNKQYLQNAIGNTVTYINGLGISRVDDNTITVNPGSCYDSTDSKLLILENSLEKQNTTQASSLTYYVYLIGTEAGNEDVLISTLDASPNLPEGYVYYRLIGKYTTDEDNKIDVISVEQLNQYNFQQIFTTATPAIFNSIAPDYTHARSISVSEEVTMTEDGWLICSYSGDGNNFIVNIDGVMVWRCGAYGSYSNVYGRSVIPVTKGSKVTTSGGNDRSLQFVPCKGGN